MKTTVLWKFSACACLTGSLLVLLAERSLAQSTGISNTTLPVVTIRAVDPEASEPGANTGMFHLLREGPTNLALHAFLEIGGTASNGVDYGTIPNWTPIPAGVRTVPILVRPIDDNVFEGTETVRARLVYPPIMAPITYQIGNPSNAVVSIYDNDPAPTNRPPWVSIVTPTNGAVFPAPVDILIAAHAGDPDAGDYAATVEFFAGTILLGVRTNNPSSGSPVNPFMLVWSNAPPGNHRLTARATDTRGARTVSAALEILVYAPRPLVTVRATDPNASEPGLLTLMDSGEFTVTRNYGTNVPLTVYFSISGTASNGVDYLRISNSAVIPIGQLSAKVMVYPRPDNLAEPMETVVLRLQPPVCPTIFPPPYACYEPATPREAVVFIADNHPPTNLPPAVRLTRPLDGQTFVVPVKIPLRAVTVDPDGYVPHIEFYAGTNLIGEQTRYFLVPPPPGQEIVYEMVWTNPPLGRHVLTAKAQDNRGAEAVSPPVHIWIVRTNEPPVTNLPPVVCISAPDAIASEGTNCIRWVGWSCCPPPTNWCGTNTATFVVRRCGPTNDALTVCYRIAGTASNGVDYAELPGRVTILAGRRATEVKVVPIDDLLPERLETVVLRLCVPPDITVNVPPYLIGYPGRAAAVIVDNDAPRPATSLLSDRCFHIMRPGANGTCWRIECSSNLVDWTAICTTVVTDGALHFVDPDTDGATERYYRAVPEANPPAE